MPNPAERKERPASRQREEEHYIKCPSSRHPYKLFAPIKKLTEALRVLMTTKNYITIMTQLDTNQYIIQKRYLYCDKDIWISGEDLVFNENPKKKVFVGVKCVKAMKECICYGGDSNEFLSACPKCKTLQVFIKKTPHVCKACNYAIFWNKVEDLPYAKIPCAYCPQEIGWEKSQKISDLIISRLTPRKSKLVDKELKEFMDNITEANEEGSTK